jgi:hypothetical protein
MSIGKKNKDHLKEHGGIDLVAPVASPKSNDPLRFWTGHPTENILVDLRPFAEGENEHPNPTGAGSWGGPFTGRRQLIAQLAPAIQARVTLLARSTVVNLQSALRAWWRLLDRIEATPDPDRRVLAPVESVADLNELHEAAAHRYCVHANYFKCFVSLVNAARKLHVPRLPELRWEAPKASEPIRTLIPEEQAKAIKTCIKQDWEKVLRRWAHCDTLLAEAQRRTAQAADPKGATQRCEIPSALCEDDERLLKNLEHLLRMQQKIGKVLPTSSQLLDEQIYYSLWQKGIDLRLMRGILFPKVEEADVAFHLALMNSGWNPSTLANLDGSSPALVFDHPKDTSQTVLAAREGEDEEVTMQAPKPRAHDKMQFCTGLKKHSSSPPVVVATYLQRVAPLRQQLISDYEEASDELARLQTSNASEDAIARQFKRAQTLRKGCRSVWLYVDLKGGINWIEWRHFNRYRSDNGDDLRVTYVSRVLERLNHERGQRGAPQIPSVTASDFRDIYARWVYLQTGGNILAVMLALGQSSLASAMRYLDNNIFSAQNDEDARRFMTHLFAELNQGRVDLTILAQLVRNGPLTPEMQVRLEEYRQLMRSRIDVGCNGPRHPPEQVAPRHQAGKLCGPQRCLRRCQNARFLPESLDGIVMRVEELYRMSDHLPRETWLQGGFEEELGDGEYLLDKLYPPNRVAEAREKWRDRIARGEHVVPGLGLVADAEWEAA